MSKWNSLLRKLPRINTYVYMLSKDGTTMGYGKLCVFLDSMDEEGGFFSFFENISENPHNLVEGDIFWKIYGEETNIENNVLWGQAEEFPYWITERDLAQFIVENAKIDVIEEMDEVERVESRSQILDIRD